MKRLRLRRPLFTRRRVVVLAVLTAIGGGAAFVWRVWQTSQPEYHWVTAQVAVQAGQAKAAKLELQNLLKALPDHGPGHRLLAQLLWAEARSSNRTVTMADIEPAFVQLQRAAECLPKDLPLQKQVLTFLLEKGRLREAADVAERIKSSDSGNPDVLYALTWRAVDGYRRANAEMNRLAGLSRSPYQSLVLQIEFQHTLEHESHVQAALEAALAEAESSTVDELFALTPREYESLLKLCRWGVERAADQTAAAVRLTRAVGFLARIGSVPPADDVRRRRLADAAETADQLLLKLQARFPSALAVAATTPADEALDVAGETSDQCAAEGASDVCADAPEAASATAAGDGDEPAAAPPPAGPSLAEQVEQLRRAAVAADAAAPLVYYQSAAVAFAGGNDAEGVETLRRGLKAGELLPAARQRELLDLRFLLARKLIDLSRYPEADEQIVALRKDTDSRGWADWLHGMKALKQGRCEQAHESFQQARLSLGNILPVRWGMLNALTAVEKFDLAQAELQAIEAHLAALTEEQTRREATWFAAAEFDLVRLRVHLGLDAVTVLRTDLERLAGTPLELTAVTDATNYYMRTARIGDALALLADVRKRLPHELRPAELTVETLLRAGRADEAGRFVADFTSAAPDEFRRRLFHGRWLLTQRNTAELAKWVAEMEAAYPPASTERCEISVLKTWGQLQLGDIPGAREASAPLRADPHYAVLATAVTAAIDLRDGAPAEAEKLLASLRSTAPDNARLGLWQVRIALAQGNLASAAALAADALEVTAVRRDAMKLLVDVVVGWSQFESPAASLLKVEALLAARPQEPAFVELKEIATALVQADEAFQLGRADVGLAALDVVAEKLPAESPLVSLLKAKTHLKTGGYDRAVVEADRALQQDPLYVPALLVAAEARLHLGRPAEALDLTTTVQTRIPNSVPAALCRAEALRQLNRPREAAAALEPLATLKLDAHTCFRIALLYQACNLSEQARVWGRKTQEVAATPAERQRAEMFLGNLALDAGLKTNDPAELSAARDYFAAVFAADSRQEVAGNNLAWLLAERFQQPAEAVRVAEQVRGDRSIDHLAPDFIDTLVTAYRRAERWDDAIRVAESAAAARPREAGLHLLLGTLLATRGRIDEARRELETALQLGLNPLQAETAKRELATLAKPSAS